MSLQFDENRTIRSRYESSLRASLRVTKYLENWNVDKPFATLHVSPMATKLLSVTVSNHGNLCSKDLDPYYRYMYYRYIIYIMTWDMIEYSVWWNWIYQHWPFQEKLQMYYWDERVCWNLLYHCIYRWKWNYFNKILNCLLDVTVYFLHQNKLKMALVAS